MIRLSGWRPALHDYVLSVWRNSLIWGEYDCALFAADAIKAMTGEDIAAPYRGRYKTLIGGLRLLKKDGFANHAEFAASRFEEIHPSHAQIGDIAAVKVDDAAIYALGVVQGARIYVLHPETGIGTIDLLDAERAFRV
ncbi:DUF6950 family protein [Phyllobacterium leguminum]|uniref:DUF6950 domain-containing protein n=1 Tax=Phyllobacterium leguminum TaxID=314237 RepID=A0A318T440_9HYPH|nr:hypothetical protein [Phyllobacterium leguminum]PYE89572.1 hypothetical protein C7477_10380 [Phyllobacterium leguminum]